MEESLRLLDLEPIGEIKIYKPKNSQVNGQVNFELDYSYARCQIIDKKTLKLLQIKTPDFVRGDGHGRALMQSIYNYCLAHDINRFEALMHPLDETKDRKNPEIKYSRSPLSYLKKFYIGCGVDLDESGNVKVDKHGNIGIADIQKSFAEKIKSASAIA